MLHILLVVLHVFLALTFEYIQRSLLTLSQESELFFCRALALITCDPCVASLLSRAAEKLIEEPGDVALLICCHWL